MVTSSIVDHRGRPIDKSALSQEIATPELFGVRRVIEDAEASGLTPQRLARILKDAQNGHIRAYLTLAEEMEERYMHYAAQLQTRKLAIQGIGPSVDADESVPTKIVDAVRDLVETIVFDRAAADCTDGIAKGFAAIELMWEYQDRLLQPVECEFRDPRFFQFDRKSLRELRLAVDGNFDGEELPGAKFIIHTPRSKAGIPIRSGLARSAAWGFLIQSFGLKDWAAFSEIYGVPLRVGRYGSEASEAQKKVLLRAVRGIANDAAAIIPRGTDIEFHKVEGQHGAAVFGELIDYIDRQISKLVLGQTMTSDDGSSMAQAMVHNEVRLDLLKADCEQLAHTMNRDLVEPFVAMNFGPQAQYPQVSFPVAEPEDTEALAKNISQLVPFGLKVSQDEVRAKLGLSKPADDEELLIPPAQPAKDMPEDPKPEPNAKRDRGKAAKLAADLTRDHVTGCACGGCKLASLAAGEDADPIDELADAFLEDWEDMTEPLLAPFRSIIANATSIEDALERLDVLETGSDPLADRLARATAIARGLGDVKD